MSDELDDAYAFAAEVVRIIREHGSVTVVGQFREGIALFTTDEPTEGDEP